MSPQDYFSSTVPEATEKYLAACETAGASIEVADHPLPGPNGESLQSVVAWIGPRDASSVALFVSGTHGIEAYAGSGILTGALNEGKFAGIHPDTAVLMINLINPWGCAWSRRENEDNADVFRDLIYYKPELFVDDSEFDERFYAAFSPKAWHGSEKEAADSVLAELMNGLGVDEVTRIFRRGQHKYADCCAYNGRGESWSTRLYRRTCDEYLAKAQRLLSVDIHTGWGEHGDGILMTYYDQLQSEKSKLDRLNDVYGKNSIHGTGFANVLPAHPRTPYETVTDFHTDLDHVAVGLEFGTYQCSDEEYMDLWRYMSTLQNFGDLAAPGLPEKFDFHRKLFYPATDEWNAMVYARGSEIVRQTLAGIGAWHGAR